MAKECENCVNNFGFKAVACGTCTVSYYDGVQRGLPSHFKPKKTQTNADRIRASTDSELEAEILAISLGYIPWCDGHCESQGEDGCDNCIGKWLQQPAEDK